MASCFQSFKLITVSSFYILKLYTLKIIYSCSATAKNLRGMLLGRLFVGTGMGIGPPVAALYVAEVSKRRLRFCFSVILQAFSLLFLLTQINVFHAQVSPAYVRGTYGSCSQLATCLGLMGALFIGFPAKQIEGW